MRSSLFIAIFFLVANPALRAQTDSFRIWTDARQQHIEAVLMRVDGDKAMLKLRNGTTVAVPLATLSEADRNWIGEHPATAATDPEKQPPAAAEWPRMVTLPSTPTVQIIREDPEKKDFVYETEHYEFLCDSPLGANLVREFSRIFEATWLVNCLLPLDFQPAPEAGRQKYRARIFTYPADYFAAGGPKGSAGVYMNRDQSLKLPLSSLGVKMFGSRVTIDYASQNYHTLIHEITHQMMNHWVDRLPIWYVEGSAEYIAIAKYESGRFNFLPQEKALQKRLTAMDGGSFQMVPLEKLMTMSHRAWQEAVIAGADPGRNYNSALALTYYFYHRKGDSNGAQFKEYLRAASKLSPWESDDAIVNKYLLQGGTYETLQKDVQQSLRREGILVNFEE